MLTSYIKVHFIIFLSLPNFYFFFSFFLNEISLICFVIRIYPTILAGLIISQYNKQTNQ